MRRGLLILLLLGCSSAPALAQNNPVPFVNQPLVPSAVAPGGPDFTLTVNGTGFVNGATVNWNGTALATTFVSSSQLTATVPAAHTALIGTATVTVINPGPGGGASIPALFPVNFAGSVTGRWTSVSAGGTLQVAGSSATGDFNGDGFLDLALPYRQSGVAILQGDGMGGFTLNPSVPSTGSNPLAIAVGDFNGDGKLDLAVTNCSPGSNCNFLGGGGTGPGSVTILLGDGAGNFTVGSSFATGTNPTSVTVGDFNGDGNIDMVVANTDSNDLTILLGDGTGNFTSTQWVSGTVGQGVAVAAGDFNGDGKLDLATTGGILLGDGKGGFTLAPSSVGGGFAIVVADFNGDGKLDIALGSSTSKVTLYLGDGAGGFTAAGTYDTEPPGCAVACYPGVVEALAAIDIDNDGKPELAILSDAFGLFVASVSGTGQLSIQPVPFTSTNQTYPASLAVGDFDQAGKLGVARIGFAANGASVLLRPLPVQLLPTSIDFGTLAVGATPKTSTITLTNNLPSSLTISAIGVTGADASSFSQTNNCPISPSTLSAAGSCTITVSFAPTTTGTKSAALTVSDNALGSAQQTAQLAGSGIHPVAALSPTSLSFGNQPVLTSSPTQPVTLTNSGSDPLAISNITASSNYSQTNDCGSSVAASASCTINVTFTPTTGGTLNGSVNINDNAAGSPQSVSLSGTGVPPSVTLSKTSLDFGSQPVSVATTAQIVTLTNNGPGPLLVTGVTLGGTNPGDFAAPSNCAGTITFPGSCTISITFTPQAGGLRSAVISIADDAVQSPQTISVSGTGVLPTVSQSTNSLTFAGQKVSTTSAAQTVTISNTGAGPLTVSSVVISGASAADFAETDNCKPTVAASASCSVSVTFKPSVNGSENATLTVNDNAASGPQTVTLTGTGLAPLARYAPASVTFTNATVGTPTAAQTVTLTNTGGDALSITSILVSASFAQTNNCPLSPATLAASASCAINITFSAAAAGTTFGALIVSDNALGSAQQTVPLTGIASVSFGNQNVGTTSAAQLMAVMNSGTSSVTVASLTTSGDFAAAGACGTLAPGGSCAVNVTFTPTQPGTRTGALVVAGSLPGGSQSVPLVGTGVGAAAKLSVASASFASQLVGTTSAAQSVTLTNSGNATMTITGIGITGTNAGDFASTYSCGATLAAGADCTISITFKPTTAGARAATLTIADNASGSPQTVPLTGTDADFAVTPAQGSSTSATVAPGGTASYTLSLASQGGLDATVNLTCTGAPSGATCIVNPASFSLSGANPVNPTVTVTTQAATIVAPRTRFAPPGSRISSFTFQVPLFPDWLGSQISNLKFRVPPLPGWLGSQISNLKFQVPFFPGAGILDFYPGVSSPQRRSGISNFESGISSSQRGSGILNFESGIPVPWLVAIALVFLLGLSLAALACLRALAADREPRVANFSSRSPSREPLAPILRPRFPMRLSFAALLLFALISVSCGGGGNDTIIHNPGTPGGDYLLTITATTTSGSSTVTHTITLDLKVT